MEAILVAMSEGVNVVGTLAWSILDNLEWGDGFTVKFGMQHVNFTGGQAGKEKGEIKRCQES